MTVQDMSTSGALFVSGKTLASEGDLIVMTMRLDVAGITEDVSLTSMVRNIRSATNESNDEHHYMHGIEFQFAGRQQSILLHAFVYEQIVHKQA